MRQHRGQISVIFVTLVMCVGLGLFGFLGRSDKGHAGPSSSSAPNDSSTLDNSGGDPSTSGGTGPSPPADGSASPSDGPSTGVGASRREPTDSTPADADAPAGPVIVAPDGTPVTPDATVPPAPEVPTPTSAVDAEVTQPVMLPMPYEQAETFVREYWTISDGESEEEWRTRVGQYGSERVNTRLGQFPFRDGVSSEVQITPLTEINGAIGNAWAEFNIIANVTTVENGERVETLPLPMYVSVRLESEGWIVSGFSFYTA